MDALVDASGVFRELVDRIKASGGLDDKKLESKRVQYVLFWGSKAFTNEDVVRKDLGGGEDKAYAKLVEDVHKEFKEGFFSSVDRNSEDEKKLKKAFPELDGDGPNKELLLAILHVGAARDYFKEVIRKGVSGMSVKDVIERVQSRARDIYVHNRKNTVSVSTQSAAKQLYGVLKETARFIKGVSSSSSNEVGTSSSSTAAANTKGDEEQKMRAAQRQQYTSSVTKDFMVSLAETGNKDIQQMLGAIDGRAKELAAHTMSLTFLLAESFRTYADVLRRMSPMRLLAEFEGIVKALEPLAPDERRQLKGAEELERAYVQTRREIEDEFTRLQDRVLVMLERIDRARLDVLGSQYVWQGDGADGWDK